MDIVPKREKKTGESFTVQTYFFIFTFLKQCESVTDDNVTSCNGKLLAVTSEVIFKRVRIYHLNNHI